MADEVLIVLISESVLAPSLDRRTAAGVLLDLLKRPQGLAGLQDRIEALDLEAGVTDQAKRLIAHYRLDC